MADVQFAHPRLHIALLLCGSMLAGLHVSAPAAHAQDATWNLNPGSTAFETGSNWSTSAVPTGTAFLGASNSTSLIVGANVLLGGITQTAAAAAPFSIFVSGGKLLTLTGGGLANNSAVPLQLSPAGALNFLNASTAGPATISTSGVSGRVTFHNTSTAGTATITGSSSVGGVAFFDSSSAADAKISITPTGVLAFNNSSTAGTATITALGTITFNGSSRAGASTITLNGPASIDFFGTSTGDQARIIANAGTTVNTNGVVSLTAGSIEGAGTFSIDTSDLTVGSNGLSTEVSGTIDGAGGSLVKSGTGTLTLSGDNTYSGGTTISLGRLQVGNGGTTGSLGSGNVVDNAILAFNRSDTMTVANAISGSGTVQQIGPGRTILTGANSYSGTTTIAAGTLQVGNGGTTGSLGSGNVVDNAILAFNRSDTMTVANAISGSGTLQQIGAGTTILTGANSYSGTTTIAAGTLQVGNGGTTGSLGTGNVVDNAALAFNRSDIVTVANAISGSGTLQQIGTGTTILTGANSYSGTTTIAAGTLQVGNGGTTGALGTGNVVNNAALAFNRSDTVTVANAISGSGALRQIGAGTTILTGANSYGGTTTIAAGTLQVGNGGTTGSLGTGNVVNNAALAFNRLDHVIVGNVISGSGDVHQIGPGGTALTGANTYTGTTTISGGALELGAGTASGSLGTGNVVNNGRLVFDRTDTFTVSNAISGSGTVEQVAFGTTILTGANSYSGGTIVGLGGLQVGNGGTSGSLGTGDVRNFGSLAFNRSDDVTVANTISGTGTVQQIGVGKTTLTGANSYSGTTTISAGTLQVGDGGTTGSLGSGNVVNNGRLILNRSDAITLAAPITGTGSLLQMGNGTTSLNAANTYSGPTIVTAGRLAVNGSIASNVTVAGGGNLGGIGLINGTVLNIGTLSPGNSIGTLTVNGSYTQAAGSTYQVEVNAAGQGDRLNVTGAPGAAVLQGGTVAVVAASGTYSPITTYTIVNATGGVTGTFANVASNYAFLTPSLTYDANNVFLNLQLAFAPAAATPNESAVGNALDRTFAVATGDYAAAIAALSTLNPAQGRAALNALSGLPYTGFGTANLASGLLFMNTVGQEMGVARRGVGEGARIALAAACEAACEGPGPWSAWGSAVGSLGTLAGDRNAPGLTYNLGGFIAGIDYRVDPRILVGLALGYTGGTQWMSGFDSRGNSDTFNAAVYASLNQGALYVDALAGYGYIDNRLQRSIVIPGLQPRNAQGHVGANQFTGQAEIGYRIGLDDQAAAYVTPFARFQAVGVNQTAFSESGAGALSLDVAQQTTTSVRSVLGADVGGALDIGKQQRLAMDLRLGWAHEYADLSRPVTASFAGAPGSGFTIAGPSATRDSVLIGLGARTAIAEGIQAYLRYDGDIGVNGNAHAATAGIRLSW